MRETVAPEKAKEAGPAFPATEALAAKRAELRAAEVQRIDAKAQVDGTPPDLLYRFILESAAMQRRMDVRRAIDDALRLANRILPEGTDVRIETGELRDSVSGHLLDATSDTTSGDIVLATYAMNPAARLGHEGVHTLVTKGHLAPAEVDLLARRVAAAWQLGRLTERCGSGWARKPSPTPRPSDSGGPPVCPVGRVPG